MLFYSLKTETNWFQIGVWAAVGVILITILTVIVLATKNSCEKKKIKNKKKRYDVEIDEHEGII